MYSMEDLDELFKAEDTGGTDIYHNNSGTIYTSNSSGTVYTSTKGAVSQNATGVPSGGKGGNKNATGMYHSRMETADTIYRYIYTVSQGGKYPVLVSASVLASKAGIARMTAVRALDTLVTSGKLYKHATIYGCIYAFNETQDVSLAVIMV